MRYVSMGSNPKNMVTIPALSGGVNLDDALNLVDDNQMTDCKNAWYKNGLLQTRPGIAVDQNNLNNTTVNNVFIPQNKVEIDGNEYTLSVTLDGNKAVILALSAEKVAGFGYFVTKELYAEFEENEIPTAFAFYNGKPTKNGGEGLYMLTSKLRKLEQDGKTIAERKIVELYELVGDNFEKLTDKELYSPAIYINGKGDSYNELPADITTEYAKASFFEGHSLIYGAWENYYFTTDGVSTEFTLPIDTDFTFCDVEIEYTYYKSGLTHKSGVFTVDNTPLGSFSMDFQNYYITVEPYSKTVKIEPKPDKIPLPSSLGYLANNLLIRVRRFMPTLSDIFEIETFDPERIYLKDSVIHGCEFSESFGGNANGIYSGTRTFLAGIKTGENANLLAWSGLNEPTYFSENTNVNVGDYERIYALGKQDDMLVIFKRTKLHYTVYSAGVSYTAQDVVNGKVVDVSTLDATFPIIQISDNVGCDLPQTIQLCGSRLIWATRNNKVYMLKSANQYSMVNVSPISQMVERDMLLNVKNVSSCTFDGHYLLKSDNKVYVMNYDQYYFNALPSYSDSKKSQRKMQWFIWELPKVKETVSAIVSSSENLAVFNFLENGKSSVCYVWEFVKDKAEDSYVLADGTQISEAVEMIIQTKIFDFGALDRFKSVEQMYIDFGKTGGEVCLEYVTESGKRDGGGFTLIGESDMNSPQFVKTKRFLPGVKRALKFGVRLTSKGNVAVGGVLIKYKYMGVMR